MPQYLSKDGSHKYKIIGWKNNISHIEIGEEEFPLDIDEYINLGTVYFKNFPIEKLPYAFSRLGELGRVKHFKIKYSKKYTRLYDLPEEIGLCTKLITLKIIGMRDIPDSLQNCKELLKVKIRRSIYRSEIPSVFYKLPNIIKLVINVDPKEIYLNARWLTKAILHVQSCCTNSKFYTHNGNTILNNTMRQGYIPNFLADVYHSIVRGQLSVKGSLDNNEPLHLYRGVDSEYVKNLNVGDIIYDNGFSSFSSNINIAKFFTSSPDGYIIDLKYEGNAIFLGDKTLSYYPIEQEFIIGPQTTFKIISIDKEFTNKSMGIWIPVNKLSVVILDVEPLQNLIFSDHLEKEFIELFSKHETLINTKTMVTYNTSILRQELLARDFSSKQSDFYTFIIAYLKGSISEPQVIS